MPPDPVVAGTSAEWMRLGRRALRAGRPTAARLAFQSALAADAQNAGAWRQLARLSAPRARLAYLTRAIELGDLRARAELRSARRQLLAAPAALAPAAPPPPVAPPGLRPALWRSGRVLGLMALVLVSLPAWLVAGGLASVWFGRLPASLEALVAWAGPASRPAAVNSRALAAAASPTATRPFTPTPTPSPSPTSTAPATSPPSPTGPPTATALPAVPAERWIEVDLSDQLVLAREGEVAVSTFLASTGTWQYPTVQGEFQVYVKYPAADMAGPGYYLPAVPYVMYFYEGYGLHGTYWHSNFGTPMSHGCVNLRTEDAGWLFEWASVGTRVVVHE